MKRLRGGLCPLALVALVSCDLPTAAPIYDTLWEVPGKSTSISVNTLLPSGVQVTPDGSAFQVNVSPSSVTVGRSLGQDCSACAILNGMTAPKPPFSGSGNAAVALPSGLVSATLVRDTLALTITNGYNFDPLRPSATARGYLLVNVKSGSTTIGRDSIDGAVTPLAANATLQRKVPLSGTINGANGIQVVTTINSPAGDPVVIDVSRTIAVSGSVGGFFVSSAQVSVANQPVTASPSDLDLSNIDSTITKRVGGGSLLLKVDNPFNVAGNLSVTFTGASMPIQKSLTLAGGTTTPAIPFSKDELAAMFGRKVSVGFNGSVNGATVVVAPNQVVSVSSRLQVALTVGGK
jgi:hypothetical protein